MTDRAMYLASEHDVDRDVERKNLITREWEAAAGCSDGQAWLSLTDGGDPIAGTTVAATEAAGRPGAYVASWSSAELLAAGLGSVVGQKVYPVLSIPSIGYAEPYPVIVRLSRSA